MKLTSLQKKILMAAAAIFLFAVATPLFAQNPLDSLKNAASGTGVIEQSIPYVVAVWVRNVLAVVGVVFLILTIYGGIRWMTSAGNEKSIDLAKKVLTASIIGLVIIMTGYSITYFIIQNLTNTQTQSLPTQGGS